MTTDSILRPLPTLLPLALAALLAGGCQPNVKSTLPTIETIMPIAQTERFCPVTGEPVTDADESAFFETYPVYCKGRENARQFASLSATQRARLAKEQVLPRRESQTPTARSPARRSPPRLRPSSMKAR